jgi:hypothetical protein
VQTWKEATERLAPAKHLARWAPFAPAALVTGLLAGVAIQGVLAKCGHPAVPLDDAFIHFQYAKRLATGHFFSYTDGEGYSSGATSLLWPLALAPFYLAGLRDHAIAWGAWILSFAALFGLAVETYRLALKLAGRGAAIGAGAMVLSFGGYAWCAASGMEVVPLAWMLALAARQAVEWAEGEEGGRTVARRRAMIAVAFLLPLLRPEGMLGAAILAATLLAYPAPGEKPLLRGVFSLAACAGVAVVPLLNLALTGHTASSTTVVKWLPANPYYREWGTLVAAVRENARLFVTTLLDGREWSAVYVPSGARIIAVAGLFAIPLAGFVRGRRFRGAVVLVMALGMLIPCTYFTFLWNRLRYLWPFAFSWFIGLACLASLGGDLLTRIGAHFRSAGAVLSGVCAGAFASHLGWTLDDLATSASAIDRQQVALGLWARDHLEPGAVVGVNDTGAIAYFGGHPTFDVVGLTTPGEAPFWVAGAGSRWEHYERLHRASPERLPKYFIVYPVWMSCDALLGDSLHEATVTDQTILGGTTMTVYQAEYDLLGSGDEPAGPIAGDLIDELDVADLESEKAHAYELGMNRETDDLVESRDVEGRTIVDGARVRRSSDRFVVAGKPGRELTAAARFLVDRPTRLTVAVEGTRVATLDARPDAWSEHTFVIPAGLASPAMHLTVQAEGARFGSAHYWFYARSSARASGD